MPLRVPVKGLQCQLKGIHKPPGPTDAPITDTQEGRVSRVQPVWWPSEKRDRSSDSEGTTWKVRESPGVI